MKHITFTPQGVCSRQIDFDIDEEDDCQMRGTSCADQLAKAIDQAL